jgi:hypothetical protein
MFAGDNKTTEEPVGTVVAAPSLVLHVAGRSDNEVLINNPPSRGDRRQDNAPAPTKRGFVGGRSKGMLSQ